MKNKKLLLIATAAMGVVALGTGAVSTLAWFQSTAAMSFTKESLADKTVSVVENELEDNDLKATVHISATPTNNNGILLSEWYDSDSDETPDALRTNVKDTADGDHYSTEGKLYEVFTIKMWITRDDDSEGTTAEWNAAKAASAKTATYTFAFDSGTNLAANDTAFFTDAANTITYAKEQTNAKTLACAIADLPTTESTVHGYFFVRILGVGGTHTSHTSGTTYSAVFNASGVVA